MKLSHIYNNLKGDLQKIEKSLSHVMAAEHDVLNEASVQLLKAGGKRIRPALVLLGAKYGDSKENMSDVQSVAVSLELIHMATLVHDDVVDDAPLRRGRPTVKETYGNRVAMYVGDYMLARALEIMSTVKNEAVHRVLSKTLVQVVYGEIAQIEEKYNIEQNYKTYFRRIKRKTALLIAASCQLGALAAGADDAIAKKLYKYGYNVGMSFQIIDDILDFTSSQKALGKPTANDLLQGNITLPVLFAMEDESFYLQLENTFLNQEDITSKEIDPLLEYIYHSDVIEQSYRVSNRYLNKALNILNELPKQKTSKTLQTIALYVGKRKV